jgi:hypothetical protein
MGRFPMSCCILSEERRGNQWPHGSTPLISYFLFLECEMAHTQGSFAYHGFVLLFNVGFARGLLL